jgi:hypothetical protein
MADVKISALPAASALAGADLVPVVQGGITEKATVTQLQAAALAFANLTAAITLDAADAAGDTFCVVQGGVAKKATLNLLWDAQGVVNANASVAGPHIRYCSTATSVFTAPRTLTLPLAADYGTGRILVIADGRGAINGANTWTIQRAGSDVISLPSGNVTSFVMSVARETWILMSDSGSSWTLVAGYPYNFADIQGSVAASQLPDTPTKVTFLTAASGTFTVTANCRALYVEMVGGGGGGGGADCDAVGKSAYGGGGAGANYSARYIASPLSSYAYVVGQGGAGGAATGGVGGQGTASTWGSTVVCQANGGNGGGGHAVVGAQTFPDWGGAAGNATSLGANADTLINGSNGGIAIILSINNGFSGHGGASGMHWGGAGFQRAAGSAGDAGRLYGGGGSGGIQNNSVTGNIGGVGGDGAIRVTEYF